MQDSSEQSVSLPSERGAVSLRTLVMVRWITVCGQVVTLLIVHLLLGLSLPFKIALAVVAVSAMINIVNSFQRSGGVRLGERDALMYLVYDVAQLAALLYLTGGLENPFAFLLLAPVTVGAGILSRFGTVLLVAISLGAETMLAGSHLPLPWDGEHLVFPSLYILAVWLSLIISTIFISAYTWSVTEESRRMSDALGQSQLSLAREQRVSAVGALAAAAAHELGSPLGTIAVIAKELARDLPQDSPFREDAQLLMSETARCRTILAELARRRDENDAIESPFDYIPILAIAEAAGEPHLTPRIIVQYVADGDTTTQPLTLAQPEILHGLGNLIQNAIQFAQEHVEVVVSWTTRVVVVEIADDGIGFSTGVMARLGEPYISSRSGDGSHMGLGIFIAKTLLQNTGATLTFRNALEGGAVARVIWPRTVFRQNSSSGSIESQHLSDQAASEVQENDRKLPDLPGLNRLWRHFSGRSAR